VIVRGARETAPSHASGGYSYEGNASSEEVSMKSFIRISSIRLCFIVLGKAVLRRSVINFSEVIL